MSTVKDSCYSDTCAALDSAIRDLSVRIQVSKRNQELYDKYKAQNEQLEVAQKICTNVNTMLSKMSKDVQKYITEKRKTSMQNINNALRLAGEIIQDSTEGIYFQLDKDEAWLSTPDGMEVDQVEGGGYRQISSTFVRSVLLESNTGTLNTLLLDELFSVVSQENSTVLSLYLNIMCQNMQVVSIEQKPQVYSNIDSRKFTFTKKSGYTNITMEDVTRDYGGKNGI